MLLSQLCRIYLRKFSKKSLKVLKELKNNETYRKLLKLIHLLWKTCTKNFRQPCWKVVTVNAIVLAQIPKRIENWWFLPENDPQDVLWTRRNELRQPIWLLSRNVRSFSSPRENYFEEVFSKEIFLLKIFLRTRKTQFGHDCRQFLAQNLEIFVQKSQERDKQENVPKRRILFGRFSLLREKAV